MINLAKLTIYHTKQKTPARLQEYSNFVQNLQLLGFIILLLCYKSYKSYQAALCLWQHILHPGFVKCQPQEKFARHILQLMNSLSARKYILI